MDAEVSRSYPIVDSHTHYPDPSYRHPYVELLDAEGITRFNVVCLPHWQRLSVVPDALHLKAHHPDRIYVCGSMDYSIYLREPERAGRLCADYVDTLLAIGCDGVKMWEGKPNIRKAYHVPPFDSPAYAPYWERLAELQVPLNFHLNDPAVNWDPVRVSPDTRAAGWFYGDGAHVGNETQYTEVIRVLERHPNLKVIFPHFMFFSAELSRLGEYLDRYPNMYVDLAPGSEMYRNFCGAPVAARDFFLKYQDRILYGTDYGAGAALAEQRIEIDTVEAHSLFRLVQGFLELEGEFGPLFDGAGEPFYGIDFALRGIALPPEVLEKIYSRNFYRVFPSRPRALVREAIGEECTRLMGVISRHGPMLPGRPSDTSVLQMVREFFAAP